MATHASILAWRIPWTEEPGRQQSIRSQRVGHNWSELACTHTYDTETQQINWELPGAAPWGSKKGKKTDNNWEPINCCCYCTFTLLSFIVSIQNPWDVELLDIIWPRWQVKKLRLGVFSNWLWWARLVGSQDSTTGLSDLPRALIPSLGQDVTRGEITFQHHLLIG